MEKIDEKVKEFEPEFPDQVIEIPKDEKILEALRQKLNEYKQREVKNPSSLDTRYKRAILEGVLKKGITSHSELFKEISPESRTAFNSAFNVILSYTVNGGKNLIGGTGLPELNKNG